jgi:hypothetical protein
MYIPILLTIFKLLEFINCIDIKEIYTNIKLCNDIQAKGELCEGSKTKPFPDLLFALSYINLYDTKDDTLFRLIISEPLHDLSKSNTYINNKANFSFFDFFQKRAMIRIRIEGFIEENAAAIPVELLVGVLNINFIINGGEIHLENIIVRSNLDEVWRYLGDTNFSDSRKGFIQVMNDNVTISI